MEQDFVTRIGPGDAPVPVTERTSRWFAPDGDRDLVSLALRAAIVAVVVAEVIDSATYRWRRSVRSVSGWEASIEHRRRMRRYGAELGSLQRRLAMRR